MQLIVNFFMCFKRTFDRVTLSAAIVSTVAVATVMLTIIVSVVSRWMNISIIGIHELNALIVGMCVYLSIAFTQFAKKNISVNLIVGRLSNQVAAILDIPLLTICAVYFGWTSYLCYEAAFMAFVRWDVAEGFSRFPLFPLRLVLFLGVVILTIQLVIDVVWRVSTLVSAPTFKLTNDKKRNETGMVA